MSRKLVVNDGRHERELLLVGTMVVGRDPTCDISDADPLLSRRHVEFIANSKEVIVRDLGSRNGILINGVKIAQSVLRGGDVVQVGHLQVRLVDDGAGGATRDADETAMAPPRVQRQPPPSPADMATVVTPGKSSISLDEPTERVARPSFSEQRATADTDLDRTIPAIQPAAPAMTAVAVDPDKTQAAPNSPGAQQPETDPEKTRFAGPVAAAPQPRAVLVAAPSRDQEAARVVRQQETSFALTPLSILAIVVLLATGIPYTLWPGNGSIVWALPVIVSAAAVWITSRLIDRRVAAALTAHEEHFRAARHAAVSGIPELTPSGIRLEDRGL